MCDLVYFPESADCAPEAPGTSKFSSTADSRTQRQQLSWETLAAWEVALCSSTSGAAASASSPNISLSPITPKILRPRWAFFFVVVGLGSDYLPSRCSRTRVRSSAVEDNLQVRRRELQKVGLQGSFGWGGRVFVRLDQKPTFRLFLPTVTASGVTSSLLWLMLAKSK